MALLRCVQLLLLLRCISFEVAAGPVEDPSLSSAARQVLVKEIVLDSAVVDIVYLGSKHECILVTTKTKRLYFSDDGGQKWEEVTSKIEPAANIELVVERIIVNNNDKSVAVLQTKRRARAEPGRANDGKWYPYTFVSEDSGRTWRKAWGKHHGLHSWISHPKKRDWALVSWWTGDCDSDKVRKSSTEAPPPGEEDEDDKTDADACVHRLMMTRDLGKNFVQIASYVVQFSWGSSAAGQANRVYYTAYRGKSGDQGRLSSWTSEVDFYYTEISAAGRPYSSTEAVKFGNKFLVSGDYILVARVKSEALQTVNLMVSKDGANTFKSAMLPSGMGELEEKWYTVLDTSEGAVILHINSNNEDGTRDTGRIFISDPSGVKYSQALANNLRSSHGECEFDKIVSLQGVYMANVVVPEGANADSKGYAKEKADAAEKVESEASAGAASDKKHGRGFSVNNKVSKEERTIRTVVSFDKGGAWNYLKPPRVDSLGKAYDCAGKPVEECSLHLHGTTSWDFYAPFYSVENSVGLIMGTGNVGPALRFEPEEANTFLSRDGGLTWMEAHKGAYIYEFGDHGGIIVMANDLQKTIEVVFTWNEGQSWYDFKVSKTPFEVDNIITEPNLTSTSFIMFGAREDGVGVLYYMKFDALQFPKCKGVWAADSVSSDYESWSPSDGDASRSSGDQCMLGQQIVYTRRKRTSQCWNGEDFDRSVTKKTCACTKEDFACDIGFSRAVGSMECVFGGPEMLPERLVPTICSGTFGLDAYRKVPGDICEGGWVPQQAQVPCPSNLTAGSFKMVLCAVAAVFVLYMGYTKMQGGRSPGGKGMGMEFSAGGGLSPTGLAVGAINAASGIFGFFGGLLQRNAGIDRYPDLTYKKLTGNEFDMEGMGGNEESLAEFLDGVEQDDVAPRVYGSADDRRNSDRPSTERSVVAGSARSATEAVPRLQAPPSGAAASGGDDDLL
eukprot:TRINITY_DN5280_c0_g2_i1.p1 TRINITY_DN5280_c0_g2~~TRINITY_DN5280_c0_g2_i1.p1  ORF type:complete len:956 (-),score=196.30 TRINITY_DN5280_c0_g2_i1:31-2898(-)